MRKHMGIDRAADLVAISRRLRLLDFRPELSPADLAVRQGRFVEQRSGVAQGDMVTRRCLRGNAQITGQELLRVGRVGTTT